MVIMSWKQNFINYLMVSIKFKCDLFEKDVWEIFERYFLKFLMVC